MIDVFEIEETYSPERFEKCLDILAKSAPFHIKEFNVNELKKPLVLFFMKHLAEGLETICLNAEGSKNFPFDELLTFPVFFNAKQINISELKCTKAVSKLAEQWIINDSPIGNKFQCSKCSGLKAMEEFVVMFVDRILSKNENNVRIRTDNESKHILLKVVKQDFEYICCSIISSNMQESEYKPNNLLMPQILYYRSRFNGFGSPSWDERVPDTFINEMKALGVSSFLS